MPAVDHGPQTVSATSRRLVWINLSPDYRKIIGALYLIITCLSVHVCKADRGRQTVDRGFSSVHRSPLKDCTNRLSNNPSTLRQAQCNACRVDSEAQTPSIRPRTKSPSEASGRDSTFPSVATTPTNSSCRLSGGNQVFKYSHVYLLRVLCHALKQYNLMSQHYE